MSDGMGPSLALAASLLLLQQEPQPRPADLLIALPGASTTESCGLGDGGLEAAAGRVGAGEPRQPDGTLRMRGGVVVEVRNEGVKLSFPSGREMLFMRDGHLHLRSGEHAGPFGAGLEFTFANGEQLRVVRSGSTRAPLEEVLWVDGGSSTRIWGRSGKVHETVEPQGWGGPRVLCAGSGDAVYHAVAIGPLLALEAALVPDAERASLPHTRLVLAGDALAASLVALPGSVPRRRHDEDDMKGVVALADASHRIFAPQRRPPLRVEQGELRWSLHNGFELSLAVDERAPSRLVLHRGAAVEGLVEWQLGAVSVLRLSAPPAAPAVESDRPLAEKPARFTATPVRMRTVHTEFEARAGSRDLPAAAAMVRRLLRED